MKYLTRATISALGLFPLSLFADNIKLESRNILTDSRIITELQQGKKTGGSLDALMPLYGNQQHFWFANMQAYKYGDTYQTVSLGAGYRTLIKNSVLGFYGFYDWQTSENKVNYNRLTLGGEHLGETWNMRLNLYYYLNRNKSHLIDKGIIGISTQGGDSNNIYQQHLRVTEKVYSGGNIEMGRTLGLQDLRGYLGYYNFANKITGPSIRINYQLNDRLSISASTQHDNARGWLSTGGIHYWFGKTHVRKGKYKASQQMYDPIIRDMTVAAEVIDRNISLEKDPRSIYFANVDNNRKSAGAGTQNNPTSLSDAVSKAGENDIIYIMGSDAMPYDISEGLTLKNGQTLWGSSEDLYVDGFLLVASDGSINPILHGGNIDVTGAATLAGFDVVGSDGISNAINIISTTGPVSIHNVNLSGIYANAAINIAGSADISITNSSINATAISGIAFANAGMSVASTTGTVSIDNLNLDGTYSSAAILIDGKTAIISNSQITNYDSNAIVVDNGGLLDLTATSLKSNNANGLLLDNASSAVIDDVTANENGAHGFLVNGGSSISVSDSSANENAGSGMRLNDLSHAIITGSSLQQNTLYGLNSQNSNVTVSDSIFNENTLSGLLAEQNSVIDASGSQFNNNDSYGLETNDSSITAQDSSFDSNTNGLLMNASSAVLTNITANNNLSDGLLVNGGSNIILSNSFANFNAGSGMQLNDSSNATITGSSFQENTLYGLNSENSDVTVSDSIFNANTMHGLRSKNSNLRITASTFNNNTGSGLLARDDSTIDAQDSKFSNNNVNGFWATSGSTLTATNSVFTENGNAGLAVYSNSTIDVTESIFNSNEFGLLAQSSGELIATKSTFNNNIKDGIYASGDTTQISVSGNSEIKNNTTFGLFVIENARVNVNGGTITGNDTAAAQVEANGVIHFNIPTVLNGEIKRDDYPGENSQITVNTMGQFTNTPGETETKTCSTMEGVVTCS